MSRKKILTALRRVIANRKIVATQHDENIVLYHGTTLDYSKRLLKNGWKPNSVPSGANQGQPKFLYLTNILENARWFSEQKGENIVLEVTVPKSYLLVDPEDGHSDTVDEELNSKIGFPGYVVCYKPLAANSFKKVK